MKTQRRFRPTADGLESRDVPAAMGIASRFAQFQRATLASRLNTPFSNAAHLGVASIGGQVTASRTVTAANNGASLGTTALINQLRSNLTGNQFGSLLNSGQLGRLINSGQLGNLLNSGQLGALINTGQLGAVLNSGQFGSVVNNSRIGGSPPLVGSFGNTLNNGLLSTLVNRNFPATLSGGNTGVSGSLFNNGFGTGTTSTLAAGTLGFFPFT